MNTMTTIGASLTIKGEITSNEDVTVHGKLHGKISVTTGALLVAQHASVEAEAAVARVKIEGTFSGDVSAAERVELSNTANVSGTIVAPSVVIQDGAVFNGMIDINRKGEAFPQKKAS
jgi:cytoskeletal protein CcmA (bactofilin family)